MSVTLLDRNGNPVTVADPAEAASRFLRGELYARGSVPVMRDGRLESVDASELEATLRSGGQLAAAEAVREQAFSDQGEQAFVEGAMRGVTAGASDAAAGSWDPIVRAGARLLPEAVAGDTDTLADPRDVAAGDVMARQEVNPIAAMGGEAVGVLSTLAAGPGRAVLPGGAALEAGVLAEGAVRGAAPGLGRRALGAGIGGAVEGSMSNLGIQQGAAGLRDEEFTGEAAASAAGMGAVLGFAGGAAFEGVLSPVAGSVRRAFSREAVNRQLDRLALGSLEPTPRDIAKMRGRSFDPEFIGRVIRDDPRLLEGLRSPEEFLERAEEVIGQELGPEIEAVLRRIDDEVSFERLTPAELRERIMREVLDEQDVPFNEGVLRNLQRKVEGALGPERAAQLFRSLDGQADDVELDLQKFMTPEELELYRVAGEREGMGAGADPGATLPGVRRAAGAPDPLAATMPGSARNRALADTELAGGAAPPEPGPFAGREADPFDVDVIRRLEDRAQRRIAAREAEGTTDRAALLDAMTPEERALYVRARDRAGEFEARAADVQAARARDDMATPVPQGRRARQEEAPAPPRESDTLTARGDADALARAEAKRVRRAERLQREVSERNARAAARAETVGPDELVARQEASDIDRLIDRAEAGGQARADAEARAASDALDDIARRGDDARVRADAESAASARAEARAREQGDVRDGLVRDAALDAQGRRIADADALAEADFYRGVREELERNARERATDMRARSEGIGVLELHQMRRAIDKDLFKGKVGRLEELSPAQQALKDVRDVIDDLLTRRIRSAQDQAAPGSALAQVRDQWRLANEKYQAIKIAQDLSRRQALRDAADGLAATPSLPLPMIALLTGNPGLAVVGWLAGIGKRWIAENGRAAAAIAGTRLARVMGLHLSANGMRRSVAKAASALATGRVRTSARMKTINVALSPRDFSDWLDRQQRNLPQDPEALDQTTDGSPTLAEVADADLGVATAYATARTRAAGLIAKAIDSKMREKPYQPGGVRKLGDLMPLSERRSFVDYVETLRAPQRALEDFQSGRLSLASARALREGYPAIYTELVLSLGREMAERGPGSMSLQQRLKLQMMFPELPQDPHAGLPSAARWQERFLERDGGAAGGMLSAGGGGDRSTPRLDDDQQTRAQQITE